MWFAAEFFTRIIEPVSIVAIMQQLMDDIADAIRTVDRCGFALKEFQLGVGP